ncbi:ATP-grasp fold amidoligase family protein, partial [Klebsiella pneumoniae]|uniref:ATP-grasp fold amidoligase family protein n=1 Tax=Klebsiella pneumoniae TaxID=573 RepID=UPI0025A1D44C
LYDRKPEYTTIVDKYAVRSYIAETIGEQYLVPLLGRWERAEDIDFDTLPNQFVLKCNHDSGCVLICKDKATFDKQ